MSKTKDLEYNTFGIQKYVTKLPAYLATLLLKIRSHSLPCKVNQSSSSSQADIRCRLCHQAEENQEHIVNCYEVNKDDEWLTLNEYASPQLCVDEVRLKKIYTRYIRFHDMADNAE